MRRSSRRDGPQPRGKLAARLARPKGARLGQHFLAHPQIAVRIVRASGIVAGETVLEVGPGGGILTAALLGTGARVVAVEADPALLPPLRTRFAGDIDTGALTLIEADIRDYLEGPMKELEGLYAVVANIPYYLTGEILRRFLEAEHQPHSLTLLVQKEVAERVARAKKESLLSLSVKAYGVPRYDFTVSKGAFRPAPAVDSAVLTVTDISRSRFASGAQEERFFALVHAGFAHKRKRLARNLAGAGFTKEAERVGDIRAEDLSLAAWLTLAK